MSKTSKIRNLILSLIFSMLLFCAFSVQAEAVTQDEAVAWAKNQKNRAFDEDGAYGAQCVDWIIAYSKHLGSQLPWGHAYNYATLNLPAGWTRIANTPDFVPQPGDIAIWNAASWNDNYGHVAVVLSADLYNMTSLDQNWNTSYVSEVYHQNYYHNFWGVLRPPFTPKPVIIDGYDRTLPDGDYIIAVAANPTYFLDIPGTELPAKHGSNVALYHEDSLKVTDCDVWTLKYDSGFYKITQKGTGQALDVTASDTNKGANVQVWDVLNNDAQKWAISKNGKNGYRLQAKCSGYSLDFANGNIADGTNVLQWEANDTIAQAWVFIPYKPSQPIANGRYVLTSALSGNLELDVEGDSGSIPNPTNVQVWADTCSSRYNSFDIQKLSNGYYKLTHAASGKVLDVYGAGTGYADNICVHNATGSLGQQWAIIKSGSGYALISRCSGYAMDVKDGKTANGTNVFQYPYNGHAPQTNHIWYFVQAEYSVKYSADGASNVPAAQKKYYKNALAISTKVPTKKGYSFSGWSYKKGSDKADLKPGASYTKDADVTLYACFKPITCMVSFDVNGGSGKVNSMNVNYGTALGALPVPTRSGYDFTGWFRSASSSADKVTAKSICNDEKLKLYAHWKKSSKKNTGVAVKSIKLNKTSAKLIKGKTLTLKVTISPSNATNKKVTFKSSNTKVATVDKNGKVKAVKKGKADITVTSSDGSRKAVCKITVSDPVKVKGIKFEKDSYSVKKGKTITLKTTFQPKDATNKDVTFKSSNTKIATIDKNGKVKGIKKGSVTITVTTKEGNKKATCKITVK